MDTRLLELYVQGKTTSAQTRQVVAYLATDDGQAKLASLLDEHLHQLETFPLDASEQAEANRVFEQIKERNALVQNTRPSPFWLNRLSRPTAWLAAAMVSLLLVALGGWWLWPQLDSKTMVLVRTAYGQTRTLTLPDGSVVTLNGHSSVRYPGQWLADEPREVWVEGEAFFDVVHTRSHQRFSVYLPAKMRVDVLGTRFNVYTRQPETGSRLTKVTLDTGQIRLSMGNRANSQLVMQPGEMVVADLKQRVFYKKQVNTKALSSWRSNKLIFDGMSLGEIAQMLEDTYGVTVSINDSALRQKTVSGSIPNQDISTILAGLSTVFDLHISRRANHITIQ